MVKAFPVKPLGEAEFNQRTRPAMGQVFWRRGDSQGEELLQTGCRIGSALAYPGIKRHVLSPPDLIIEKGSIFYLDVQHLLQTKRLGAELDPVAIALLGSSVLEFNGVEGPLPF